MLIGNNRVDFTEFKRTHTIESLAERLNLALKRVKPNQLQGNCPFSQHGGDRNSGSFAINTSKDIYICPTHCGSGVGIIDFYCDLMGLDRRRDAYRAVMEMRELFGGHLPEPLPPNPSKKKEVQPPKMENPLKNIRKNLHLTLEPIPKEIMKEKKIHPKTWEYFGVGMALYGSLRGCVSIPMHDREGNRIGYAGQKQEDGSWNFHFAKSVELYNLHRIWKGKKMDCIILVEGFFSVMYLHQSGIRNVVAGMGVTLSDMQIVMLKEISERVLILYDNDNAGRKGMSKALEKLPHARAIDYPKGMEGAKPRDLETEGLKEAIGNALRLFS
jgi:DNA primase